MSLLLLFDTQLNATITAIENVIVFGSAQFVCMRVSVDASEKGILDE